MVIELSDPTIQGLLIGAVGNGLWALVAQSTGKASQEIRRLISPPTPATLAAIRTAIDNLEKSIKHPNKIKPTRLVAYLKSPDAESIVRQIFATSLVGSKKSITLTALREEFLSSMSKHLDVDELRLRPFADSVLDGLIASVEGSLDAAIKKNVLSAHEAKDATRHQVLLDEILNVQKNLDRK